MKKKSLLKSLGFMSLSLFLATVAYAVVEHAVPAPPGRPEVFNIRETECAVRYEAPLDQGSSPITGYLIESREEWRPFWEMRGVTTALEYHMTGFTPRTVIKFRISASNEVGMSEPSEPSDFITLMNLHP